LQQLAPLGRDLAFAARTFICPYQLEAVNFVSSSISELLGEEIFFVFDLLFGEFYSAKTTAVPRANGIIGENAAARS
jgi:hypothetical protein